MPARGVPEAPHWTEANRAERAVWERLRDQLPEDAVVFHSLSLTEAGQDYELDLLVAWPGVGLAVLEVKGGRVSLADGQWRQGDRQGEHDIDDPVRQAEDGKHVLLRFLQKRGNPAGQARVAHLVALPYTDVPQGWELPGCRREQVVDRGDLASLAERLRAAVEHCGSGHRPASDEDVQRLVASLSLSLSSQQDVLALDAEHEERVRQMTADQLGLLHALRHQRRMKVTGSAGTGKTWLAMEQARRLTQAGERVALVCYSRGLAWFLRESLTGRRGCPEYVGLFHDLPLQWGASPPPADPAAQSEYYERLLPAETGRLAAVLPPEEKYDSVVVDEAQDFGAAWWEPTLACLRDRETGGLFAFLDEAQRVFNRYGEVPIDLPPYPLDENIRNTKRIAQTFGSLAAEQPRYLGLDGPPVRFVQASAADVVSAADDEVERLLDVWAPGQVALLTTGHRHPVQQEKAAVQDWDGYWRAFFAGQEVFYGHVLGFKGLERPAVVLAVNGLRDRARAREYLYVGLSRARTQLVVVGDLDEIAAVGGEGLRRRLAAAAV